MRGGANGRRSGTRLPGSARGAGGVGLDRRAGGAGRPGGFAPRGAGGVVDRGHPHEESRPVPEMLGHALEIGRGGEEGRAQRRRTPCRARTGLATGVSEGPAADHERLPSEMRAHSPVGQMTDGSMGAGEQRVHASNPGAARIVDNREMHGAHAPGFGAPADGRWGMP
jgi:hypothetical protein